MTRTRRITLFFVIFFVIWGLTTHGKYSVSGDEPHYLMIAESLLTDGDLDLQNNYADNDGRLFGRDGLSNDGHATPTAVGTVGSVHDIGLPVLILPIYAVARHIAEYAPSAVLARVRMSRGLFVYAAVSLAMITLVAWSCVCLLSAMASSWPAGRAEYLLCLIALSPPVLSHAYLLFPETIMFALTCVTLATALDDSPPTARFWPWALLALAIGYAPWLHRKFSPYALALAAVCWWTRRDDARAFSALQRATLVGLIVLPQVLLYMWTWHYWGTLVGPQFIRGHRLDLARIPNGILGLFADRESGLLAYAPFYLLLPASLILAAADYWPYLLAGATLVLPMAAFDEWWGGFSPGARYLVPTVPIMALCLARGMRQSRIRTAMIALGAVQVVLDAILWQRPRLLWPQNTGMNALFASFGYTGVLLQTALPTVRLGATALSAAGLLIAVSAFTFLLLRGGTTQIARPFEGQPDNT